MGKKEFKNLTAQHRVVAVPKRTDKQGNTRYDCYKLH